jgi:hypothetical protein
MHLVIGTPAYGGMMCTEYVQSLLALKEACLQYNIKLTCIFLGNESLIQRGRPGGRRHRGHGRGVGAVHGLGDHGREMLNRAVDSLRGPGGVEPGVIECSDGADVRCVR